MALEASTQPNLMQKKQANGEMAGKVFFWEESFDLWLKPAQVWHAALTVCRPDQDPASFASFTGVFLTLETLCRFR